MAYKFENSNPIGRFTIDCIPRAVSKALDVTWEEAYIALCNAGLSMCTVMCADEVLAAVLRQNGFYRDIIPNTCPDCYTVNDFCDEHPKGIYVLELGGHVVAIVDGIAYDTTNPGKESPLFYWYKNR